MTIHTATAQGNPGFVERLRDAIDAAITGPPTDTPPVDCLAEMGDRDRQIESNWREERDRIDNEYHDSMLASTKQWSEEHQDVDKRKAEADKAAEEYRDNDINKTNRALNNGQITYEFAESEKARVREICKNKLQANARTHRNRGERVNRALWIRAENYRKRANKADIANDENKARRLRESWDQYLSCQDKN